MTDSIQFNGADRILPTALHQEMQRSYLEYAMSVIVGRALPDARDGLKPVQRRILYAMHELGLTPDRPFRKSARVVGDVLGKYHPHGDQAVYDALVRLVQDFSSRYPLLAGHGNFGSIDNDPPAAMRYTETRLAPVSHVALLEEIGEETVDFVANFDNSQQEPSVLPAQLPFLLLNGCSGIAVGMATNIPPHNLGEIVDALIALIDRPQLSDRDLLRYVPGPDFPTGGEVIGSQGILDAYLEGRGSIPVRGIARIEEIQPGKGRHRRPVIIVTELPYQVSKAGWIEKVADLVNDGKLQGIADIRDESDREGMRVVIELRRDAQADKVLEQLYKRTALQSNFGAILLAIVEGQPQQLSLKQLLEQFLSFREGTLRRRYGHELEQTERRLMILEGLLRSLSDLDGLIEILRQSPDGGTARARLQVHFDLNERQADAVLSMPMRRITSLEQEQLQQEAANLREQQARLQTLLGDRPTLLKALKKDLRDLKRRFGSPRRTRLPEIPPEAIAAPRQVTAPVAPISAPTPATAGPIQGELIFNSATDSAVPDSAPVIAPRFAFQESTWLCLSDREQLQAASATELEPWLKAKSGAQERTDFPKVLQWADPRQDLLVITAEGRAYRRSLREVHPGPIANLLPTGRQSTAIAATLLLPLASEERSLLLLSSQGRVKRLALTELAEISNRGLQLLKLAEEEIIQAACLCAPQQEVLLGSSGGRLLRLSLSELPLASRISRGQPRLLRLREGEQPLGCLSLPSGQDLLLVSTLGLVKRLPLGLLRLCRAGDLGNNAFRFTDKRDRLIALLPAPSQGLAIFASDQRLWQRSISTIAVTGTDAEGQTLFNLRSTETLQSATTLEGDRVTTV
ncbi:DNA gyrase/topoisomerase IV subunit A [Synechococcus elongatus]|uniref:DNA topoisomerase (ATP-hydrolyzing) n=1 Tax=Synechococcus elongatus (strain ATCC 33912 / PCC 7942 / FACHB-805) TaxID=1140 RepID=Q31MJ5_SYNE7|nr:DNA topoisomerase (ATP-hydrolyzing) [Synechococcus elongatus]ABB57724.1 DNA topoisomerase IV subunit A [Synechococcus elongatus PCC 7942 = FACHB-805]AJD57787.1 DNA topoisomerase IV subunit A [Synechococcus elongatus UTEX 2973]MBD2586439.1 DNA topoisomerase 4 subunit A [Synechococcus elongatus FACHB-242]MBD2687513.1 DNA topoisomerase 4 subunit A [Synechococcus elongatus FACHB-1061]MBD2706778.1 DNA topoisomerase 4 subunit A [Synechococcus elongatus PCC 7942 = FACHB-805]